MAKARRAGDASEYTRAVDQGGTVTRGEVVDDTGRLLYWARRPFGYGGDDLDRGQIVAFAGARNDEKLIRLGYVLSVLPKDRPFPCRFCQARFIDLETLEAHGHKRHSDKAEKPNLTGGQSFGQQHSGFTVDDTASETERLEREQDRIEQIAPLNLDKTTASRGA